MSSFLALTPKSSKQSAFLWKGVLEPRKHVWRDFEIAKDMHVSSQDMALAYNSTLFRESLSARLLKKVCIFSTFLRLCQKPQGGREERSHFHDHNSLLVLPFHLFAPRRSILWICSGYTLSSDGWHTSKNYVSPRDQKLPAFMSSLAWGLVTAELRLNTSMSISRRWGSTSTSLHTLLRRDVRRFWIAIMSLWNKTLLLTPQSLLFKGNGVEPPLHPCLWPAVLTLESLAATRCCY